MTSTLAATAQAMVAPGKGILAADESVGTANKRFKPLGIAETEEMRRRYREMLFTTPNFGEHISGVILFDETLRQADDRGTLLAKLIEDAGAIPGIKVDTGTHPLPLGGPDEKITEGLDGLAKRVEEYVKMGARFAKWRAVIAIDDGIPTDWCIAANTQTLARYAGICQAGGLVPIVEPEVLMDGEHSKHTLEASFAVHERTLRATFDALATANVRFEEMLLKPSMVIPGQKSAQQVTPAQVAEATLTVLLRWVPAAVGGVAFLSGGQSDEAATVHLNEINKLARQRRAPWNITFSYGRALQHPALEAWMGKSENAAAAQALLAHRAKMNGAASLGEYSSAMERTENLVLSR